jgi:ribosome-associated toxin RatA of RatAB toxin-antitoxin module
LSGIVGTDKRVERIVKELQITATPEQVIKLIADLEQLPTVATVSRVQIRKPSENEQEGRKVKADISVETWVVARKGKAR